MSGVSMEAASSGDSTEIIPPPLKKAKTEVEAKAGCEDEEEEEVRPIFRKVNLQDPEYMRQRKMFIEQFKQSGGYDVEWNKLEYLFKAVKFEWFVEGELDYHLSKKHLKEVLIKTAIDEENDEYGTKLEFVKYVSANVTAAKGYVYYLTFWAQDLAEPNPVPKLYQAQVRKFDGEIIVHDFRLKPTPQAS